MNIYRHIFFFFLVQVICMNGISQIEDSVRYDIRSLNLNSKHADFSPFLFDNKLYFSSGRINDVGIKFYTNENHEELIDVFYAAKKDSGHFKQEKSFSEVNTRYNDGPICISKDGKQLYITRNDVKRTGEKEKKPLSIYLLQKTDKGWGKAEVLPFCTGANSYCHPALLTDGTLVFASDMIGGYGAMDLYYTRFENGSWTHPKNFGSKINSSENEVFPFVSPNNILYFSANRKTGLGGLDIYSLSLKDSIEDPVRLLESPVNGPFDDFGIWLDSTERNGYFSSNRDSLRGDEIFSLKNKYPDFDNCQMQKRRTYCYTFFEESTSLTEDTLGMEYEWDFGDGNKKRGLEVKHCFKGPGNYSVQLNIIEKTSGNLFF